MQGATVLVVDDDPEIRDLIAQFLTDEGYQCRTAASGREVLPLLEPARQLPDVMVLDLMMPGVNGYDVLETLRRNMLQAFPVLIVSAQRPDGSILKALDSELRDFIAKPFDLEELDIRVKRLLQRSPRFGSTGTGCLRIYALGSLRVYLDDALLFNESWRNKPAKTIFKLLYTQRGRRVPKDVLAEELWPETESEVAANRLRVAIHELRKVLGTRSRKDGGSSYIAQQEGTYYFNDEATWWSDVDAFDEANRQGREFAAAGNLEEALHAYQRAEALYQGDFLRDDQFLEWTIATRERLREAHLAMLSEAAQLHAMTGAPDEAASFCRKIIRAEPWREEVYRHLMGYLAEAGRPHEALRVYEECRRALMAEVEAEPSLETAQLRDRIALASRGAIGN